MKRLAQHLFPTPMPHGIAFFLLFLIVAGLPLVFVPQAVESFTLGKETLFRAGVSVLFGLVFAGACLDQPFRIYLRPINGFVLGFIAWNALSILWAESGQLAWEETGRLAMLGLFFFFFQSIAGGSRRHLLTLGGGLAIASLLLAGWLVLRDFRAGFAPESLAVRSYLGDWRDFLLPVAFGNTSHLADFLVMGFLLWLAGWFLARPLWLKSLATIALWIHAAALIVSWSVHSNLSLIVAVLLGAWLLRFYFEKKDLLRVKLRSAVLVAGWIIVCLFYVVDHPANPHGSAQWASRTERAYQQAGVPLPEGGFDGGIFSQAFASPRWTSGLDTRIAIWLQTLEIVKNNPWLGTGAGNFTYSYPAAISGILQNNPELARYSGSWTNAAHNEVLQAWSELGIVGAFLLVVIVALAFKNSWDRIQAGTSPGNAVILALGAAMLAAMCLQAQMNFPLQLPVSSMLFFLLLALPHVLPARGQEPEELLIPVERPFGSLRLGILMKNMAYPTEFRVRIDTRKTWAAGLIAVVPLALGAWMAWQALIPLRADIAYRDAYEAKRLASGRMATWSDVARKSRAVLAIWPHHADARSTLQDALLRQGDYDAVLEQTPRVLEKLNASEVYLRRALALEALGRTEEAAADWDVYFTRKPEAVREYPQEFQQYLERLEARQLRAQ